MMLSEAARLEELHGCGILDTAPEAEFDDVVSLAAMICQSEMAGISLVDADRVWFKSTYGLTADELPRDQSLCSEVVARGAPILVEDLEADPQFAQHPRVIGEPGLRLYAGYPLFTPCGHVVGALWVADRTPHRLCDNQRSSLQILARQVGQLLEMRRLMGQLTEAAKACEHSERLVSSHSQALQQAQVELELTMQATHMGSFCWEFGTDRLTCSNDVERLFGLSAQAFDGTLDAVFGLVHSHDHTALQQFIEAARSGATREVMRIEVRAIWPDGSVHWLLVQGRVIFDEAGQPVRMIGVDLDITHRKQAEQALRDAADRHRNLIEALRDAIFTTDTHGVLLSLNAAFEAITGWDCDHWLDRPIFDLICPQDMPLVEQRFEATLAGQTSPPFRVRIGCAAGGYRTVELSIAPQYEQGEIRGILGVARDATERAQAEEAVRASEERYRLVARATNDVVWDWDVTTDTVFRGEAITNSLGFPATEVTPTMQFWQDHMHPEDRQRVLDGLNAVINGTAHCWSDEYRFRGADGTYRHILDRGYISRDADGRARRMIGAMQDVTERKIWEQKLRKRDALLQALAEATGQLLSCADLDGAISTALATIGQAAGADRAYLFQNHVDPAGDTLLMSQRYEWADASVTPQIDNPELQNLPVSYLGPCPAVLAAGKPVAALARDFSSPLRECLEAQETCSILIVPILVNGQWWGEIGFDDCRQERVWSEAEVSILTAMASSIAAAVTRRDSELRLEHDSLHDALTGLPNRMLLLERIRQCTRRALRDPSYQFAVLFLDLDRFKVVNDSLGHVVGDDVLITIARRLTECLRESDLISHTSTGSGGNTVARLGGDEFTILLDDLVDPAVNAARVAERILERVNQPVNFGGQEITLAASIGIAIGGSGQLASAKDLLRDADTAMYHAKSSGRARYALFDPTMHAAAISRLRVESDLRRAVERDELHLYYQPIVSLDTQGLRGFEALVRWQRDGRLISPSDFIPIAEDTGLIVPIGRWIIEQAVRQAAAWRKQYPQTPVPTMAVNLSRRQLEDPELVPFVQDLLARTGTDPATLELEITESTVMDDDGVGRDTLEQLHRIGVRLAMDDFGTGYSSLSCLHSFPIDVLKVDRAFVSNLNRHREAAVLQGVVDLAHTLGMQVVAEGIEIAHQAQFLRRIRCDLGQGYLFARPLSVDEAAAYLTRPPRALEASAFDCHSGLAAAG